MKHNWAHLEARPFRYDRRGELVCEGARVAKLADLHGTPLYIYSAEHIRGRLGLFRRAFSGFDYRVCYAVKANSNLAILKLLAQQGAGFDIVSAGELERVLRAAGRRAAARAVFSGVGKTAEEMDAALRAGILLFNVESEGELEALAACAARRRRRARVALRVNPDVFAETHPYISTGLREHKFGIEIQLAKEVYRRIARSRWLVPEGVSVHIGSQIRGAAPFGAAVERVAKLVRELRGEGIELRSIDAGGGLGIDYHEPLDNEPPGHELPGHESPGHESPGPESSSEGRFDPETAVAEYGAAVRSAVGNLKGVRLLLEPGRFLVAQAGALIARVLYLKQNGGKRFVIADAGMNDLIRPALYGAHHEIVPVRRGCNSAKMLADVTGPVCETGDFFARDRALPAVAPGDLIAILDAGAYGMSLSSNYNSRPRAAEVLVEGRRARLVRRRETVEDMLRTER